MNTGKARRLDDDAVIAAVQSPPGIATYAITGHVTFATVAQLGFACERALGDDPDVAAIVLDVLRIDGFEPGVPARIIQWLGGQSDRLHTGALVSVSPVLVATVRAAAILLPRTHVFPCGSVAEAFVRIREQRRRFDTGTTLRRGIAVAASAPRKHAG